MQKLYYSISEVSDIVEEEQHILRYWEKEFEQLKPKKNRGGNRIYSDKDLTIIKLIKKLLRHDKLSLKGAKEQIILFYEKSTEEGLLNTGSKPYLNSLFPDLHARTKHTGESGSVVVDRSELEEIHNILKELSGLYK